MAHDAPAGRFRLLASTLPAVLLLGGVLFYNTDVLILGQLSNLCESWYPGCHELREEPVTPDCDPKVLPKQAVEEDDPFAEAGGADDGAALASAQAAQARCQERWAKFEDIKTRRTEGYQSFRTVESFFEKWRDLGLDYQRHALVLLILICAATATRSRQHIGLRSPHTRLDYRIGEGAQFVAIVLLGLSVWMHKRVEEGAGVQSAHPELYWIWVVGFAIIGAINLAQCIRPPPEAAPGGRLSHALLTVPLFTSMCLISGSYFFLKENHPAGLSIYIGKLPEFARLYLQVGLYVWIGMLLKRTRLAELVFNIVRPWRLPPELLTFVVVVGAALPTAYSGASGIFVIAVGAVIYQELRRAGARRQLALAATAMSGSLGVVLRPCLLVVIVASLNKQVTTDQLYAWGFKVFLLTTTLFFIALMITKQNKLTIAPPREAMPATLRAVASLLPYGLIVATVLLLEGFLLDAHLDENSAPYILPLILLAVLVYDRFWAKRKARAAGEPVPVGFTRSVELATTETTAHIGALLLLMGLSVCLGGIIERADVMAAVPETFGSVWTTMGLLVMVLVVIGMLMDPYGAVILVTATIASVAYRNGIDPVHFWMVVLTAFELGYLTPPVALNQLLTRQVVGDEECDLGKAEGKGFWQTRESILLPVVVMATALLIVAFVPLFFYS